MKLTLFSSILRGCCLNGFWTTGYNGSTFDSFILFSTFYLPRIVSDFRFCFSFLLFTTKIDHKTLLIDFKIWFRFVSVTINFDIENPPEKKCLIHLVNGKSTTFTPTKVSQSRRRLREIHALHQHGLYGNV